MPYDRNRDLPQSVRNVLPQAAQSIWRNVVNSQEDRGLSESRAIASAWAALRNAGWRKGEDGMWVKKNTEDPVILVKQAKQRYTLGIVYEPNVLDTDEDWAGVEVIEQACWGFMRKLQEHPVAIKQALAVLEGISDALAEGGAGVRVDVTELFEVVAKGRLGDMHTAWDDDLGEIVACWIAPVDMEINGEVVSEGTWLMGAIHSEESFAKIEAGQRTGWSMGGFGRARVMEIRNAR